MNIPNYLKKYAWMQTEIHWGRVFMGGLIAINAMLAVKVFTKETIVEIVPFTLTEDAWLGEKSASRSYKESWALAFAQLFGNVTPATVDFVKTRTTPFFAPKIYSQIIEILEVQSRQIKDDRVSLRFEPRHVEYEMGTDKVFVYGYSFAKGASSKESRTDRTYEFRIKIAKYAPQIDYIDTYAGRPRTKTIEANLKRKEEQREMREEKEKRIQEQNEDDMQRNSSDESEF